MLRALFQAVFGGSRRSVSCTAVTARFAPALEPLGAREVPAVLAPAVDAEVLTAPTYDPAVVVSGDTETDATTAKVVVQDFHFTAKVNKSSP
jgi:hypothetical protein